MMWFAHILLCISLIVPGAVLAQSDPSIVAQQAVQKLDEARLALQQADRADDKIAALTHTILAYEEGLVALRQSLRLAARQEALQRTVFETEREKISALLATMQSMQSAPETLLLHPDGPIATARAGMLLTEVTPALHSRVATLRRDLEEISLLRALQENAAVSLEQGLVQIQTARLDLSQAIAERSDLPGRIAENPDAMRALLNNSETLRAFASGLADLPGGADRNADSTLLDAHGHLRPPVSGTLLHDYNEPDAAGISHPGWVIAARPGALVTAPFSATIRYRGPLLKYGTVIILEPEQGFLMVLAGLGIAYGEPGEIVAKDAPLGLMPDNQVTNDAELSASCVVIPT